MSSTQSNKDTEDHATTGSAEDVGAVNSNTASAELSDPDSPNPFYFPGFVLHTGLWYKGVRTGNWPVKDGPIGHLKKIEALNMREDDIILAAYPKCGKISSVLTLRCSIFFQVLDTHPSVKKL